MGAKPIFNRITLILLDTFLGQAKSESSNLAGTFGPGSSQYKQVSVGQIHLNIFKTTGFRNQPPAGKICWLCNLPPGTTCL